MFKPKFKKIKYFGREQSGGQVNGQQGFLLTELIVAVFIFSIVMTISVGSLVVALDANKKAQSLKSVLNNLNVVLDTMTKALAVGTLYQCGELSSTPPTPTDCPISPGGIGGGDSQINFLFNEDLGGDDLSNDVITYKFNDNGAGNGFIERSLSLNGGADTILPVPMTAPEVDITDMKFYVTGSTPVNVNGEPSGNYEQPKVLIVIKGNALAGPRNAPTEFTVQTLVSQRVPDFE